MPKPSEVQLVASILEEEASDATEMAKRVLQALELKRRDERELVLLAFPGPVADGPHVVGPFTTPLQARKALQAGLVDGYTRPVWLVHPASIEAQRDAQDAVVGRGHCPVCRHSKLGHMDKRWKPPKSATWRPSGCMGCDCTNTYPMKG